MREDIKHEFCTKLLDYFETDKEFYLVTELAAGQVSKISLKVALEQMYTSLTSPASSAFITRLLSCRRVPLHEYKCSDHCMHEQEKRFYNRIAWQL